MKTLPFALTLCASTFLAVCSVNAQTNTPVPVAGSTSTNLAHLIASADRIVITNRLAAVDKKYRFSLSISSDEARKIVRAVCFAKPTGPVKLSPGWDMKFYRGTQFLAGVEFEGHFVVFEEQWYDDDSGVLERFSSDLWKQIDRQVKMPPPEKQAV